MQDAFDKIVVIGGGNMGGALARGFVRSGVAAGSITLVEPSSEKQAAFAAEGFTVASDITSLDANHRPVLTVLAIKPQAFSLFAGDFRNYIAAHGPHLILSVLAGTPFERLEDAFTDCSLVRVMPNTPALIGEGVSAVVSAAPLSAKESGAIERLLGSVGEVVWLDNESDLDAVTALSGSGPAYMFHLLEALVAAGTAQGLSEDIARRLALGTMRGSAGLALQSDLSFTALREQVTSPGGTTQAALDVLMAELPSLVSRTLEAAARRSRELASAS